MDELKKRIREFNRERDWEQFHTPKNLVMGISIESAELMEHFLWKNEAESAAVSRDSIAEIKDECGDVLIYLVNLADRLGFDLIEAAKDKLRKNGKKYPVDKSKGVAKKYTDL